MLTIYLPQGEVTILLFIQYQSHQIPTSITIETIKQRLLLTVTVLQGKASC